MAHRESEINFVMRVITALLSEYRIRLTSENGSPMKVIDCETGEEFFLKDEVNEK